MSIRKLRLTILVVVLVGLVAVFAWERLSIQKVSAEDKTVYEQLQIFSDVLDIVQENYVEEADSKELVEGAITVVKAGPSEGSEGVEPFILGLSLQGDNTSCILKHDNPAGCGNLFRRRLDSCHLLWKLNNCLGQP